MSIILSVLNGRRAERLLTDDEFFVIRNREQTLTLKFFLQCLQPLNR